MRLKTYRLIVCLLLLTWYTAVGQNVNLDNALSDFRAKLKGVKKLSFAGGINASTTFTHSSAGALRDPFMYTISGNMSVSWMSFTIPLNINFTNAGFTYGYQYPRLPSRLSMHPTYKNLQAHIGDFSMSFSPYTMSGFQIVGGGLEVKNIGMWNFSGFYGRFQKAVEFTPGNGNTLAAYARKGWGFKAASNGKNIQSAITFIRIKDDPNSLLVKPDSVHVYPKANVALSVQNRFTIAKNLKLDYEIGFSILTNDQRPEGDGEALFQKLTNGIIRVNGSTNFYKAYKTNLNYAIGSSSIGVGYERIDPGYQTLGAYYFTNDFENITSSFGQQLFKGKLNLNATVGLQRDDLKHEKAGSNRRVVMSVNGSLNISKQLTTSFSYSSFQSFTNVKPQFQQLNQLTPYDNLDTLNYRQLSQSANMTINYMMQSDKDYASMLNCVMSIQDTYDEQGGIVSKGNASTFYNLALNYTNTKNVNGRSLSLGLNATYNTIGTTETITAGPTMMYARQLFKKSVRISLTASGNTSIQSNMARQTVYTSRVNASYTLKKKHQIGWCCTLMQRDVGGKKAGDFSSTINYSYSF